MKQTRLPFMAGILLLAATGGLLGGFNYHWAHQAAFPLYGLIIDLCAIPALIYMILYVREQNRASQDEFAVTKKRFAAQTGFITGFALFAVSGVFPLVFPAAYNGFIASLDGANDGFIMGRVFGMAPFIIGLLIGQVAAWQRYR